MSKRSAPQGLQHRGATIALALALATVAVVGAVTLWPTDDGPPLSPATAPAAPAAPASAPTARLAGWVLAPNGTLRAGAAVACADAVTVTDATGLFACEPSAFPARVAARAPGLAEPPAEVQAQAPQPRRDLRLRLRQGVLISGVVIDGVAPAAGVALHVQWLQAEAIDGRPVAPFRAVAGRSDGAGRFALQGLWPGRLRVEARVPGRSPAWSEVLTLADGAEVTGLALRLGPGGTLGGSVRSPQGAPIAGATVGFADVVGAPVATSDDAGRFVLADLPPGTWTFEARAEGYLPARQRLVIPAHGAPSHLFVLQPPAGLTVQVLDPDDKPVFGAAVTLRRPGRTWQQHVDAAGRTLFADVGPGARVLARADHAAWAPSAEVEAVAGTPLVLTLGRPGRMHGVVVDPRGQPTGGVSLWWTPSTAAAAGAEANTDAAAGGPVANRVDGTFAVAPLRPGRYDVHVQDGRGQSGVAPAVDVAAGADVGPLRVALTGGGTLQGVVRGPEGAPAVDARATLHCPWQAARHTAATADGSFAFVGTPSAPCTLDVRAPGLLASIQAVRVPSGETLRVTVSLRAAGTGDAVALPRHGLRLIEDPQGLIVAEVTPGSAAARAGLQPGDRVVGVDFRRYGSATLAETVGPAADAQAEAGLLTLEIEVGAGVETVYLEPTRGP